MQKKKRLVVGLSGASGSSLALVLLQMMSSLKDWETHLVISSDAQKTVALELPQNFEQIEALATRAYRPDDMAASIASGTFATEGMVVIPCSMKTTAGIAHGYSENLLLRAADVTLKEGRKLVLLVRETPLSQIHLRNMTELAAMGVVLMPPMLTYYNQPQCIRDMETHIVGKVLNEFGIALPNYKRWQSPDDSYSEQPD
jgi:polyprenyl P-hydroxybenzoate/phenylacrylic acid decarboxylase-like protein